MTIENLNFRGIAQGQNSPTKNDLYKQRLNDGNHREKMNIDPDYFKTNTPKWMTSGKYRSPAKKYLIELCKKFNIVAEKFTQGIDYNVVLNRGIPAIAADFDYQLRKLMKWAGETGQYHDIKSILDELGINNLSQSLQAPKKQGYLTLDIDSLKSLLKSATGSEVAVLLLMKSYCSRPTNLNGITGISDTRMAEELGCNRTTVHRAREKLQRRGFVKVLLKESLPVDGRFITLSKYEILI